MESHWSDQQFLEKNWSARLNEADSISLTIKALLEVVDSGSKNMDVAVMIRGQPVKMIPEEQLAEIIKQIEKEIEEKKSKETPAQES